MKLVIACLAIFSCTVHAGKAEFDDYLRSGKEPKVKDFTWMSEKNIYVGVVDDGSKRDGFAQYLCIKSGDFGVGVELVKIVDISAVISSGKFKVLGKALC